MGLSYIVLHPMLFYMPLSHLAVWRQAVMLHYSLNVHHIAQFRDLGPQHIPLAGIHPMMLAMLFIT